MTRIRMVGLAIVAVFAVSMVASAVAGAAENPVLLNSTGGAVTNETFTGKDTTVSLLRSTALLSGAMECATSESAGTVSTTTAGDGMTSGVASVTFKKCKTSAGKCANKGTEEITGTVSVLLVWLGPEADKTVGVLISILPYTGGPRGTNALLSFVCAGELIDVEGSLLALTSRKIGETFTTVVLNATQTGGAQVDQAFTESGVEGTNTLFSNQNHGAFASASEEVKNAETYASTVQVKAN